MTAFSNSRNSRRLRAARGFSLIELAVVIFIVGLLLGSIFMPLQGQVESRRITDTQKILDNAREALIGYAAANGRFPCPASAANNPTVPNGAEHFFSPGGTATNGICHTSVTPVGAGVYIGWLPASTLGLTPVDASGYAVDAWGLTQNRIRYAVSSVTVNGIQLPFTKTSGMRSAGMSSIASTTLTTLLYVCNSGANVVAGTNCGTDVTLTGNAIAVIWSVGGNAATTGGTSVDEKQNPNPSTNPQSLDRIFVSRTKGAAGEAGGEFDDIVTWIGPPTLFSRLIAAGQLP